MQQLKWFDLKFNFPQQNVLPATMERLAGTPLRLIDKVSRIPEEWLTEPVDGSWSIQENVGHLLDLEILWQGRLDDFLSGTEALRSADLENTATHQADHNATDLEDLLINFTLARRQTLDALAGLTEDQVFLSSLHPRLLQPMHLQDLFIFVADHDDHHLARITAIMGELSEKDADQ